MVRRSRVRYTSAVRTGWRPRSTCCRYWATRMRRYGARPYCRSPRGTAPRPSDPRQTAPRPGVRPAGALHGVTSQLTRWDFPLPGRPDTRHHRGARSSSSHPSNARTASHLPARSGGNQPLTLFIRTPVTTGPGLVRAEHPALAAGRGPGDAAAAPGSARMGRQAGRGPVIRRATHSRVCGSRRRSRPPRTSASTTSVSKASVTSYSSSAGPWSSLARRRPAAGPTRATTPARGPRRCPGPTPRPG